MLHRLMAAALLLVPPQSLIAQLHVQHGDALSRASSGSITAAICDGAEMRSAAHRRHVGDGLMVGSLASALASTMYAGASRNLAPAFWGQGFSLGMFLTGMYMHWSAGPGENFWDGIIARSKPGETRSADVRTCLREPGATSISGSDEQWTYFMRPPWFEVSTRSYRTVSFRFKDSVLVDVRRTAGSVPVELAPPVAAPVIPPPE